MASHAVAEDLHLDMAGLADELLQIEPAVPEGRLGLGGGLIERCAKRLGGFARCGCRARRRPPTP